MALGIIADPNGLSQGASTVVTDLAFTSSAGRATTLTSTANLPVMLDNEWLEIRNAVDTVNNGLYRVNDAGGTTSSLAVLEKVSGADPTDAADTISTIEVLSHTTDTVAAMVFTATVAPQVQITAGSDLPAMVVGQRFTVFNHTTHDGVYLSLIHI